MGTRTQSSPSTPCVGGGLLQIAQGKVEGLAHDLRIQDVAGDRLKDGVIGQVHVHHETVRTHGRASTVVVPAPVGWLAASPGLHDRAAADATLPIPGSRYF